jgi:hypothetical protein
VEVDRTRADTQKKTDDATVHKIQPRWSDDNLELNISLQIDLSYDAKISAGLVRYRVIVLKKYDGEQ